MSRSKKTKSDLKKAKSQDRSTKSKSEAESVRELTELEKELFSIQIGDLEERLLRRQRLCSELEQEKITLASESSHHRVLKRESALLLNAAYRDFDTRRDMLLRELGMLEDEGGRRRNRRQQENIQAADRKQKLEQTETALRKELEETEENIKSNPLLREKLEAIEAKIVEKEEHHHRKLNFINEEFQNFVKSLRDQLSAKVDMIISDRCLKPEFLPTPHRALYESGTLGMQWLECIFSSCDTLLQQNMELAGQIRLHRKKRNELNAALKEDYKAMRLESQGKDYLQLSDKRNQKDDHLRYAELKSDMNHLVALNNANWKIETDLDQLRHLMENMEKDIEKYEEDIDLKKQHPLFLAIMQAKDVIIQEL